MGNESLNMNVRGLGLSATVAINERSAQLEREGRTVARLGLGQSPFPVPNALVESLRNYASRKEYLPVRGLQGLRDAVAGYHRRRNGMACTGDDVLIGPGSKELMFLLQVVFYGELVIPTPAWVSYAPQAQIVGRRVSLLSCKRDADWKLAPEDLAKLCRQDPSRPRIIILNYPSNPTGASYTSDELQAIAEVARDNNVLILSDEIYGELHHKGEHDSIARYHPEGTIVSNGLSKWCGAGGWRLGTFTFPSSMRWLLDAMATVASETYTSTSAPIQYAAIRGFKGGLSIERYLWSARRILQALCRATTARMREAGMDVVEPVGSFYVFPDLGPLAPRLVSRGIRTSDELAERILEETGVALLSGTVFGRPPEELTLRLALVDFDGAKAMAALETMPKDQELDEAFLLNHCRKVIEAVDRLCDWSGNGGGARSVLMPAEARGAREKG